MTLNQECPICLRGFEDGDTAPHFFWRACLHKACFRCISRQAPLRCPLCRAAWTDGDDRQTRWLTAVCGVDPLRDVDPAVEGAVESPIPVDILIQCCSHRGPPPDFTALPCDSMRCISASTSSSSSQDEWICFGCEFQITRGQLAYGMINANRPTCVRHGLMAHRWRHIHGQGLLDLGYACVVVM